MTTYFPLSTLPAPYDIVWCRFPHHEDLGSPGPKPRPGIVLNVGVYENDGQDEGEVQVVFGTSNLKMHQRRNDFFVSNLAEMDACGLDKATRFDLDKCAWLPWSDDWFSVLRGYDSPIIGHLSTHAVKLLQLNLMQRRKDEPRLALE